MECEKKESRMMDFHQPPSPPVHTPEQPSEGCQGPLLRWRKTRKRGLFDKLGEFCFGHAKSLRCLLDKQHRQLHGENWSSGKSENWSYILGVISMCVIFKSHEIN